MIELTPQTKVILVAVLAAIGVVPLAWPLVKGGAGNLMRKVRSGKEYESLPGEEPPPGAAEYARSIMLDLEGEPAEVILEAIAEGKSRFSAVYFAYARRKSGFPE